MAPASRLLVNDPGADVASMSSEDWRLSDAEVHYLWWFIQGSIMVP